MRKQNLESDRLLNELRHISPKIKNKCNYILVEEQPDNRYPARKFKVVEKPEDEVLEYTDDPWRIARDNPYSLILVVYLPEKGGYGIVAGARWHTLPDKPIEVEDEEVNPTEYRNPYIFDHSSDIKHWYDVTKFDTVFNNFAEDAYGDGSISVVESHPFHINPHDEYLYAEAVEQKTVEIYDDDDNLVEEIEFWGALGRKGAEATYNDVCGVRAKIGVAPQTQSYMHLDGQAVMGFTVAAQPVLGLRSMNYIYDEENEKVIEFPALGAQMVCHDPYAKGWLLMIGHSEPDFFIELNPENALFFKEDLVPYEPAICKVADKFVVSSSSFDDSIYHQKAEKDPEYDYPYPKLSDGKVVVDADTSEDRSLSVDFDRSTMTLTINLAVDVGELDDSENTISNIIDAIGSKVGSMGDMDAYELMRVDEHAVGYDKYILDGYDSDTVIDAGDADEYSFSPPTIETDAAPVELLFLVINGEYDEESESIINTYEQFKEGETGEAKVTVVLGVVDPERENRLGKSYDDDIDVILDAINSEDFMEEYFMTDDDGKPMYLVEVVDLKDVGHYGEDFTSEGYKLGTEEEITYAGHITGAVPATYGVGAGKINRVEVGTNYFYKLSYGWDYAPLEWDHNEY